MQTQQTDNKQDTKQQKEGKTTYHNSLRRVVVSRFKELQQVAIKSYGNSLQRLIVTHRAPL